VTTTPTTTPATARPASRKHAGVWHVVEYQLYTARRYWRSVAIGGLVTPLFYVLALGVGLGTVVNRNGGSSQLAVPYLVFVAPAFLAAAALQVATGEAAFPVMSGFKWQRTFHGIAATPVRPAQIADGVILWIAIRVFVNASIYLAIMSAFGASQRWQVVFAVPAATLCAVAFAAPVAAISAAITDEGQTFNVLFRFIVTPMFLFAGTFYPISRLPVWGQWLAHVTPLWHGTELARDAAIGGLPASSVLEHVAYLLVWLVVGVGVARWRFQLRLEK
jgi:lipooligosaccharide transport system permease protein